MTACPTDDDLAGHLAGALDPARAVAVGEHLDGCSACRSVVVGAVRGGVITLAAVAEVTATARELIRARRGETLASGAMIGRYRIEHLLGAGGMGVVYVAHDSALDRKVALKVLRPDLAGNPVTLAERLVRESRLMAKASHPGVITVHDVGRDGDQVFVAMELIHGETLGKWLGREPRTVDEVVAMFRRAGAGLAAAHRAGLVHRDFKPENVLVELDGGVVTRVLVTDFGVARAVAEDDDRSGKPAGEEIQLTATGAAVGTPAYMAPEQLSGKDVDERADVFGFAVALWEALYGVRPFTGATPTAIRLAMNRLPVPPDERPASAARGRVPGWVTRALLAALVADPAARTPSVSALLAALDVSPRRRKRRRIAALLAGAMVTGGVGITVMAWPQQGRAADPCREGLARFDAVWSPAIASQARAALVRGGLSADKAAPVVQALDGLAGSWRQVHGATCRPDKKVDATLVSARAGCLEARLLELSAVTDDLLTASSEAARDATVMSRLVSDPRYCTNPVASALEARVPREPGLRPRVAALRHQLFAIEAARDHAEFKDAVAAVTALEPRVVEVGWEPLHAEQLYLMGSIQSQGTDTNAALETYKRAAATAERSHYDYIAAQSWLQLVQAAAFDQRDAPRALEYAEYAEAASVRMGKPAATEAMLAYSRGTARVEAGDAATGEQDLRAGLAIAEKDAPEMVGTILQGLAYVYEDQGRYDEAVTTYRRALEILIRDQGAGSASEAVYRGRLAVNLSQRGDSAEAIVEARAALAIAEATLDEKQVDRALAHVNLAEVLHTAGKTPEALVVLGKAKALVDAISGQRSEMYGEILHIEAGYLSDSGKYRQAAAMIDRACEITAFTAGEGTQKEAVCWLDAAPILDQVGRAAEARDRITKALPVLIASYGDGHIQVANAYLARGEAELRLGDRTAAAKDFEDGRTRMAAASSLDQGFLASAEWGLAQAIEQDDPVRARGLVERAVARWATSNGMWSGPRADAEAWLKRHKPRAPAK